MKEEISRCSWAKNDPIYIRYHDFEWGVPVFDDKNLFENLTLEIFQAGLNWLLILKKREEFKRCFDNFNINKIIKYSELEINQLMQEKGIIRNKLKILATINNAKQTLKIQKKFESFNKYLWSFNNYKIIKNKYKHIKDIPSQTILSKKICKDLKKRGFKFIGPKIIYAFMQSSGMVNDHIITCFKYNESNKTKKGIENRDYL